ncbi:MAG: ATP-binding protein, partial [Acidobacteriota bacterium]
MSIELDDRSVAVLEAIVERTARTTGEEFFRKLVETLATALPVRYCFATECFEQPVTKLRTLAFWGDNAFAENFEYRIAGTPCEHVIARGTGRVYGSQIQELFPDDDDLVQLSAESYAAVPLNGSTGGDPIGHLVVMDDRPFGDRPPELALLELFAGRAAAELERRRSEMAVEQSEARMRQVIDLVPHFIFAKDSDGRFTLVNQAVADAYGTTVDELTGKTDADFASSAEEVEHFRRDDLAVIESGEIKVIPEETITDASGRVRYLQTVKIPFTFARSDLPSILGVSTDITERRRSIERLRAIVEGTAGAVGEAFLRSLTRHLALALEADYAMVAEIHGETVRTRAVWAGNDFADALEYPLTGSPCQEVTKTKQARAYPRDLQGLFPDDDLLKELGAESYHGAPLLDTNGEPIGLLAVLHTEPLDKDEHDSYLLSIFASRAAAELERERIEEHRRQLEAQVQHVQKLESLGVLAGGIAHDFNNLLAGILGNVDLALMVLDSGSRATTFLREIERAAQRSAELSNQMLAYSGKGRFVVGRIDVNSLVTEMTELLRSSVSKKAELIFDLATSLPELQGDATQIRQVVMNLITNASDALGEGSGSIRISTGTRQVDSRVLASAYLADALPSGEYLFLEVADTGCGMTKETLDRMFDPFFSTKKSGRGLGLAALLGIMRAHDGAVSVESSVGRGSVFTLFFPFAEPAADTVDPGSSAAVEDWRGSGVVLLADDEVSVRQATRGLLERAGFSVLEAENGRRAVEVFHEHAKQIRFAILD